MRQTKRFDVVIVGAGVAGLAAARSLYETGLEISILEARSRIGGRIYTHRERGTADPIELGAEFIHGDAPETLALLEEAGLRSVDIGGHRFEFARGRLHRIDDYWQRLHRVLRHLDATRTPDQSFRQFLDRKPGGRREAHNRRLALQFIEGFLGADARRASAQAMAGDDDPTGDEKAQRMGRVIDGYDCVVDTLAAPIVRLIERSVEVTAVRWERGAVEIESRGVRHAGPGAPPRREERARPLIRTRRLIVAVPLGVLKAPVGQIGSIDFIPELKEKALPLQQMTMGSVVRVVLKFRTRFWTADEMRKRAGTSLESLAFVQSGDEDFPVWWTEYPVRSPVMVGWRGGPRARDLDRLSKGDLIGRAVASLARAFGMSRQRLDAMVDGAWCHHWDDDPLARGAYSYQLVGGAEAPAALARPLRGTLYFAGEATAPDGRIGTVDGAIASGQRAASQVRRAFAKEGRR